MLPIPTLKKMHFVHSFLSFALALLGVFLLLTPRRDHFPLWLHQETHSVLHLFSISLSSRARCHPTSTRYQQDLVQHPQVWGLGFPVNSLTPLCKELVGTGCHPRVLFSLLPPALPWHEGLEQEKRSSVGGLEKES